jgi:mRNA deadenylase 3'-5' endonuclease subunit Ccr4
VFRYHDFFAPSLAGAGYDGAFQAKSRARSMAESGRVDGCAIFWRLLLLLLSLFVLLVFRNVCFCRRGMFVAVEEHVLEFQNEAGLRSEEFQGEGLNRLILKG